MIEILLVSAAGNVVKTLHCERLFGRIEHKGKWYAAKRMKESEVPANVFIEVTP